MIYTFPISLDDGQSFNAPPLYNLQFPMTTGWDSRGIRMTNIVGYNNGEFLKYCPHCTRTLVSECFGLRPTENRDQSWCKDCR